MKKVKEETDILESTIEEFLEINLDPNDPEKKVMVGTLLSKEERERLSECLKKNNDVFSWSHKDIIGVNSEEAKHCLNIDLSYPLVRQTQRRFTPARN